MTDPLELGPLYGDGSRSLQDRFDSRRLADVLDSVTVHAELSDDDIELIEAQSTVWLSTVDADGWPDVSYKGGAVGFVKVVDRATLEIPLYDGNGMFRSAGNIADDGRVALLFIDTAQPWRLRLQGTAVVAIDDEALARHHGAVAVVVVTVGRAFPNCGRYIHTGDEISAFVPTPGAEPPIPDWKRIEGLRDVLPADDPAREPGGVEPAD